MAAYFDDKAHKPTDKRLATALGKSKKCWDAILEGVDRARGGLGCEWKFYGAKFGWQLKVMDKKRTVLYLVPREGGFLAAMALSERAVAAVRVSSLPPTLVSEIETAKVLPEGRPARIEVTSAKQLEVVRQLMAIQLHA
jgi:hypothetical protein